MEEPQMQPWINGRSLTLWIIVLAIIAWPCVTGGTAGDPTPLGVQRGSVTFDVGTNMFSLSVHGASDVLTASAHLREATEGLVIELDAHSSASAGWVLEDVPRDSHR